MRLLGLLLDPRAGQPKLVAERVAAEAKQASVMNSFVFKLDDKPITANEIDDLSDSSRDLKKRQAVWEASKQSGPIDR